MVRLHREQRTGMTQARLGRTVGLSRTSITNIERGRQHVALHHLFAIADALNVPPAVLLPGQGVDGGASWAAEKLSPTDKDITEWVEKVVGE